MITIMMLWLTYGLAVLCLLATLLPLSSSEVWWVRAADFPRLQIVALSFAALVGIGLFGGFADGFGWLIASLLILAIGYDLALILPYTPVWPVELKTSVRDPGANALKLMVANVLMDNRETDSLFAMIEEHRPDVLLAVETDRWWCDQLDAATSAYPHKQTLPLDNTYGMFLCSKLELIDPKTRFLLKDHIPSIRTGIRLRSGDEVLFYALHPEPPSPTEADSALPRDAELVTVAKEIALHGRCAVVAGDLNDVAWSHTSRLFRRLGRMLDPRVGRGLFSTFHAGYRPFRWPLDHVYASDDFVLHEIRRLGAFGSDHFPILVSLSTAPRETESQSVPQADANDVAEAEDKLKRGQIESRPDGMRS